MAVKGLIKSFNKNNNNKTWILELWLLAFICMCKFGGVLILFVKWNAIVIFRGDISL